MAFRELNTECDESDSHQSLIYVGEWDPDKLYILNGEAEFIADKPEGDGVNGS